MAATRSFQGALSREARELILTRPLPLRYPPTPWAPLSASFPAALLTVPSTRAQPLPQLLGGAGTSAPPASAPARAGRAALPSGSRCPHPRPTLRAGAASTCSRAVPGATGGWRSWLPAAGLPGSQLQEAEDRLHPPQVGRTRAGGGAGPGAGRDCARAETRPSARGRRRRPCECNEGVAAFSGPVFSPSLFSLSGPPPVCLPRTPPLLNALSFLLLYLRTLFLEKGCGIFSACLDTAFPGVKDR